MTKMQVFEKEYTCFVRAQYIGYAYHLASILNSLIVLIWLYWYLLVVGYHLVVVVPFGCIGTFWL